MVERKTGEEKYYLAVEEEGLRILDKRSDTEDGDQELWTVLRASFYGEDREKGQYFVEKWSPLSDIKDEHICEEAALEVKARTNCGQTVGGFVLEMSTIEQLIEEGVFE